MTRGSLSNAAVSFAEMVAPDVSIFVDGTHEGAMTSTSNCTASLALSMYLTPSVPSTLAISCGSATTVVVPWISASRANSCIGRSELSMWMWPSMNPGRTYWSARS